MDAQAAAVAEAGVDERLATLLAARAARVGVEADAGTADLGDALLAARARFGIHDGGRVRLHQLDARRLEQDGAGAFMVERLAHGRHRSIEVERVRMHDAVEADGSNTRGMEMGWRFGPMSVTPVRDAAASRSWPWWRCPARTR